MFPDTPVIKFLADRPTIRAVDAYENLGNPSVVDPSLHLDVHAIVEDFLMGVEG
ncbi:hypothetical protein D3C84_1079280 [compost metagenome]|jgi:hypothetical protein